MAQSLRVLVFNADESYAPELRAALLDIPGLKIVAELDEVSLLPQAIEQFPSDIVVAHLDPSADVTLEILRQVLESNPNLAVFAVSEITDGEIVLQAVRAGVREYLVKPLTREELDRALGKIQLTSRSATSREPGKLISVIGSAGGVGCTTLATNLAVELAAAIGTPGRVALVDLDFRYGHVATLLDIQPQFTVADLCETPEQIDPQMINRALVDHPSGVRVLARPNSLAQAENITAAHCASVISALTEQCDYIVVDGPGRLDPGAQTVLDAADKILLVFQMLVTNIRNADRICGELLRHGFNMQRVHLICNRVDSEPGFLDLSQVERTLGRQIYASIPDDWKSVSAAVNIGQPLSAQWGRSRVRQALSKLALRIHDPEHEAKSAPGAGILGKLLGTRTRKPAAGVERTDASPLPAPQG